MIILLLLLCFVLLLVSPLLAFVALLLGTMLIVVGQLSRSNWQARRNEEILRLQLSPEARAQLSRDDFGRGVGRVVLTALAILGLAYLTMKKDEPPSAMMVDDAAEQVTLDRLARPRGWADPVPLPRARPAENSFDGRFPTVPR